MLLDMATTQTFRAELIASAITANCEAYHAGTLTHEAWSAEQHRLWDLAATRVVASKVMRLVCPSLGGAR